ncbi:MAG: poly(R)-hydroxyalkanoic acid synthase subunit PhaE [Nitrososphaerales archaeon]
MTEAQSKSNDTKNSDPFKNVIDSWVDVLNWIQNRTPDIPTIGPAAGLLKNSPRITAGLSNAAEELSEFNKMLAQYYAKVSASWMEATRQVMIKCPIDIKDEKSRETVKKVWIDIFEEEFTTLFDSEDFAMIFGKLVEHEVKFNKHIQKLVEICSKNLEMPTRSEIESIYVEIARIKNKLKEISDNIEDVSGGKKKDIAKVL